MQQDMPKPKCSRVKRAIQWLVAVAIIALVVGILLPAINTPRVQPPYMVDLSDLRQIGVAFHAYAFEHEDIFPEHPSQLTEEYLGARQDIFINRYQYRYLDYEQESELLVERVDPESGALRYGGYVFLSLGGNIAEIPDPVTALLAYSAKVSEKPRVRVVLYADGHAGILKPEEFRDLVPSDIDVDYLDGP